MLIILVSLYLLTAHYTCQDPSLLTIDELGLDTIWQPPWNKIRIGQITVILSLFILLLHFRLKNIREVTEVKVEEFNSSDVLKIVPVVKYGVIAV